MTKGRLRRWALSAAVGGFLFGYHAGVISGALLSIRSDLHLTRLQQGALVGILPLGAMAGSLLTRRIADALGRRAALLVDAVVFLAGAALAALAPDYGVLLAARAVTGIAVGVASSTVPLYISELAPPAVRGRLVTTNQLMITLGILASYCVDLAFAGSWRASFAVGLLPAAALLAGMLRAPETPAWLQAHGRADEARSVAREAAGDEAEADRLLESFAEPGQGGAAGRRALRLPGARPALVVGVTLAALQQLSGINAVIYYVPSIMEKTGLGASRSILYSVVVGAINVAATVLSFRLVDRVGRRPLLVASLAGMTVSLALLGVTLRLGSAYAWLSLLCILGYIVAFAVGLGPIFWLLVAEIFPPAARTAGASVSTATSWFTNFLVGLAFLPLAGAIGVGATFWFFAAMSAVALAFVARFVPETRGRSFAQIQAELRARGHSGLPAAGTRTSPGRLR